MIYMFECGKCGNRFELTESLAEHERHNESCPKCGNRKLQQRFGGVQVKTAKKS